MKIQVLMSRWNRVVGRISAASIVLVFLIAPCSAAQKITDPKAWAEHIVAIVASRDVEKLVDELVESSGGRSKKTQVATSLGVLAPLLESVGSIEDTDLLGEKLYGQSVAVYFYSLIFEKRDLYVRIRAIRRGDHWYLLSFDFNTEFDKLNSL